MVKNKKPSFFFDKALQKEKENPELSKLYSDKWDWERRKELIESLILEEKTKEQKEKEIIENEELKRYNELQEEHLKTESNDLYNLRMEVISLLAKKERRLATEMIVDYIEKNNYIYTIMEDEKKEMWSYNEGIYVPHGRSLVEEQCRKILKENYTSQISNEVISKIEADTFIRKEKFFNSESIEEVPVQNGILELKTRKLKQFTPEKIFFNKLPVIFNETKDCPAIKEHFETVLKNEEDAKVMFEIFGFFLYKDYFIEKAIMFVGDGRNGKGKTIDLMKRFLGAENCSSVPLNAMTESNFRTWDLFGKMANLAGDLASNSLKDTSTLKQTTGRDLIGADRKRKTTVNFVNYAKHVFACNELPRVYDFSKGFWERWILFEFPYTFVSRSKYEILSKEEKKNCKLMDPYIIDKLSRPEELSGLLNKALDGLDRILKQKEFSYSKGVDEVKKFWVRRSDSFTAFAMDNLEESYDREISKFKLRKAFSLYCKEHRLKGASEKNIKVVLEEMFGVTEKQDYETKLRVWQGIKFKQGSKYNYMEGKIE